MNKSKKKAEAASTQRLLPYSPQYPEGEVLEAPPYGRFGEKREGGAPEPGPYAYLSDDLGRAFSHIKRPHRLHGGGQVATTW